MKDMTPIYHTLMALAAQAAIGFASGNWWAGAAFGAAYFLGREVAQHEYKLFVFGKEQRPPFWKGFYGWSRDAVLDAALPAVVVVTVAVLVARFA